MSTATPLGLHQSLVAYHKNVRHMDRECVKRNDFDHYLSGFNLVFYRPSKSLKSVDSSIFMVARELGSESQFGLCVRDSSIYGNVFEVVSLVMPKALDTGMSMNIIDVALCVYDMLKGVHYEMPTRESGKSIWVLLEEILRP